MQCCCHGLPQPPDSCEQHSMMVNIQLTQAGLAAPGPGFAQLVCAWMHQQVCCSDAQNPGCCTNAQEPGQNAPAHLMQAQCSSWLRQSVHVDSTSTNRVAEVSKMGLMPSSMLRSARIWAAPSAMASAGGPDAHAASSLPRNPDLRAHAAAANEIGGCPAS